MDLKQKKIFVTVADGFIGSHHTEMLLPEGYNVRALSQYNSFNFYGWLKDFQNHKNLEIYSGDIIDSAYCKYLTKDIDVIFHLAALIAIPFSYTAIKGGIINFSRYLASYAGKYNIRVNCVSPGGIFDNQNPVFVKNYCNKVPLSRMGKPEDIAPAVAFLLSDDSVYVTGHNLVVDGGWTAI